MLRARVNRKIQSLENAEDLAAFALSEVLCKLKDGALPDLSNRSGLWALMLSIADYRTRHVLRHEGQEKRDRGRTIYPAQLQAAQPDSTPAVFDFSSKEPTPELVASVNEQLEYLYKCLSSDEYRALLDWELAGHSAAEMQEKLSAQVGYHVTDRTLRRKRARMRKELQAAYGDDTSGAQED
jgi:DNA-directed RNA polymerase specialized sigma24 family protein